MPIKRQTPRRFVPLVLGRMQGTIGPLEQDRELSHEILRFGNLRLGEKGAAGCRQGRRAEVTHGGIDRQTGLR